MQAEAIIHFELKYCERCGGLWLRPHGDEEVYCRSCRLRRVELGRSPEKPAPKRRRGQRRPAQFSLRIESLQALEEPGVRP